MISSKIPFPTQDLDKTKIPHDVITFHDTKDTIPDIADTVYDQYGKITAETVGSSRGMKYMIYKELPTNTLRCMKSHEIFVNMHTERALSSAEYSAEDTYLAGGSVFKNIFTVTPHITGGETLIPSTTFIPSLVNMYITDSTFNGLTITKNCLFPVAETSNFITCKSLLEYDIFNVSAAGKTSSKLFKGDHIDLRIDPLMEPTVVSTNFLSCYIDQESTVPLVSLSKLGSLTCPSATFIVSVSSPMISCLTLSATTSVTTALVSTNTLTASEIITNSVLSETLVNTGNITSTSLYLTGTMECMGIITAPSFIGIASCALKAVSIASCPDYVFDQYFDKKCEIPNYKIPTIDETHDFAQKNRHLPTIKINKNHADDGLHIGDTLFQLLETIEIQSLHIKELHDRIKILEEKLNR